MYVADRQFTPNIPQISQPMQSRNTGLGFNHANLIEFNQSNQATINMGFGAAQMGQSMMSPQYMGPQPPPIMAPNQAAMMMGEAARMSTMGKPPGIGNSYIGHPNNGWGI